MRFEQGLKACHATRLGKLYGSLEILGKGSTREKGTVPFRRHTRRDTQSVMKILLVYLRID